jgi:transposase
MGTAVRVTRGDLTAADLRAASAKCTDGAQVRRILALALVLEGRPRTEAAALSGMDRQTLSDWVHRYNADGIDGLKSRKSPGREPFLTAAQKAELRALVIQGPDPAVHKVVRWRCADLRAEVARRWSVEVHESTIGAWLGDLGATAPAGRPPRTLPYWSGGRSRWCHDRDAGWLQRSAPRCRGSSLARSAATRTGHWRSCRPAAPASAANGIAACRRPGPPPRMTPAEHARPRPQ